MHASFLTVAVLVSLSLAAPSSIPAQGGDNHPHHLERRFINPLTIGLGAGGVHKAKDNEQLAAQLDGQLHDIRAEVERLKATEVTLARSGVAPNLRRRQLGTILGAVGIHKSKETRKDIARMQGETEALRQDVNVLLQAEHLPAQGNGPFVPFANGGDDHDHDESGEDDHRLVRRQLGIILGPVAIHKAKKDKAALEALRPEIDHLRLDCARIHTAQEQRLRNLNAMHQQQGPAPDQFYDTHVDVIMPPGRVNPGGVMADHDDNDYVREPSVHSDGATYGADVDDHHEEAPSYSPPRSAYGGPSRY